ncbi:hypothetical protein [Mesobacillus campisalis]|uniref:hypothetical protein n=1 Tax=Mesobacillus campisalis TaxID=1408103 RepID=UPI000A9C69CC|nr:hypothetical protein [Mesobacillus campisalis]
MEILYTDIDVLLAETAESDEDCSSFLLSHFEIDALLEHTKCWQEACLLKSVPK